MTNPLPWSVKSHGPNIHVVDLINDSKHDEWWFLLSGDRHHDNVHALHDLERKHLDQVVERNAGVLDVGDLFCCMAGKFDPRRSKAMVREEDALANDYLDSIVKHAAEFYAPYARHFVIIGRGNHETAILKNCETDLTERLCERMGTMTGHKVHSSGYGGWVRFIARRENERHVLTLKHFHGSGGAALMSFDTLKVRRSAAVTPDADVIVCGHVHKQWVMPLARERLVMDRQGLHVRSDIQFHVRTGTYKDEFGTGHSGFHVEQGRTPEIMGAVWMKLKFERTTGRDRHSNSRTRYALVPEFHLAH